MQALDKQPVTILKGVGPRSAERLASIGITTVEDVLFHLPFRYQDRTRVTPIGSGRHGDHLVIDARVDSAHINYGRRRSLLVQVSDGSGRLTLRFFHFSNSQMRAFVKGARISCYGEVRRGPNSLELIHPEYQLLNEDHAFEVDETLTPIYPTTEGMQQQSWRDLSSKALALMDAGGVLRELLPARLQAQLTTTSLAEAVRTLHRPPADTSVIQIEAGEHPAQQRLVFEELIGHQLSLLKLRNEQRRQVAFPIHMETGLSSKLKQQLPFSMTNAQQRVVQEINADLAQKHPMQRLIQGDVGSGKTVVAAFAAVQAIAAGYQVAVMAPTELLAEQHRKNFETWLQPLGIELAWLTSRLKGKKREATLERVATGAANIIVGTHALFQSDVLFSGLALVIVDEQHRFGVHQRLALREKGNRGGRIPHQLIMTATPIPRTLAMTAYADLDLSVIDELPPGRTPVKTVLVSDQRRDEIIDRVALACSQGRQAYWVCTLIDESETLQAQAAEETASQLSQELEGIRVGLVHGRLKADQKEQVMSAFKAEEIDLLVATTVIEVGVDVPNASLMIIENPERLGLAQLHQLRGRVGRGDQQSHCALLYKSPLGETARQRLAVMRETSDGFEIARKDLEIRGPGEVLGTRQTGEMEFRVANIVRDQGLLPQVQLAAQELLVNHPESVQALITRWVGSREKYGSV